MMAISPLDLDHALAVWTEGHTQASQRLGQLAQRVAAVWSAGTLLDLQPVAAVVDGRRAELVLEERWGLDGTGHRTEELLGLRLDRPFGRRARHLRPQLATTTEELLGRSLAGVRAAGRGPGRVTVELELGASARRTG
jgi:hypothetical protein